MTEHFIRRMNCVARTNNTSVLQHFRGPYNNKEESFFFLNYCLKHIHYNPSR